MATSSYSEGRGDARLSDDGLAPSQVAAACEGLLAHAQALRQLGVGGTVLHVGSEGFGMAEDGALRVAWDGTARL